MGTHVKSVRQLVNLEKGVVDRRVFAEEVPRGRIYFQVPVPTEGATYRVRAQSFTWHRTGY